MLKGFRASISIRGFQLGFTIVELMIATMVFSVIILISSAVVVRFTSNFQRSLVQNTTQNSARSVLDNVSQTLQVASAGSLKSLTPVGATSEDDRASEAYCIDGMRYSYILGRMVAEGRHGLVHEVGLGSACASTAAGGGATARDLFSGAISGKELLSPNMRLASFDVKELPGGMLYAIKIKVAYGEADLFCVSGDNSGGAKNCNSTNALEDDSTGVLLDPSGTAKPLSKEELSRLQCKGHKGSQYCGVSELSTTIQRRL